MSCQKPCSGLVSWPRSCFLSGQQAKRIRKVRAADTDQKEIQMNIRKPLAAAALAVTVVGVGAGTAAASEGERDRNADDAVAQDAGFQQVQLEQDGQDGDNDGEGREGRRGDGHQGNGRRGRLLNTAAEVIGIESQELRGELQDGATIAEVAEDNDVDVDALVAEIVAHVEERLAEKVDAGDITEEEAADKLESKTERIEDKVNGVEDDDDQDNDDAVEAEPVSFVDAHLDDSEEILTA